MGGSLRIGLGGRGRAKAATRGYHCREIGFREELGDVALKDLREMKEPRCRDAVDAAFVFLDLLISDTDLQTEIHLRQAGKLPEGAKALPDMDVDWIRQRRNLDHSNKPKSEIVCERTRLIGASCDRLVSTTLPPDVCPINHVP